MLNINTKQNPTQPKLLKRFIEYSNVYGLFLITSLTIKDWIIIEMKKAWRHKSKNNLIMFLTLDLNGHTNTNLNIYKNWITNKAPICAYPN